MSLGEALSGGYALQGLHKPVTGKRSGPRACTEQADAQLASFIVCVRTSPLRSVTGGTPAKCLLISLPHERHDFLVRRLREILVPIANRDHPLRHTRAHQLIHFTVQRFERFWRCDRDGYDDPRR